MKTVAWGTFTIVAALAIGHLERVSIDQPARELSSVAVLSTEAIEKSANAVDPSGLRGFDQISKAISLSNSSNIH